MGGFDEVIHQPTRLRIMAALMALKPGDQVDFTYLRDVLKLSDGNVGAHLVKLEEVRYAKVEKTFVGRRPRTFISATHKGRAAFEEHVAALEEILRGKLRLPT
jgi:DNA-binding MarR family transcriptional regulator